MRNIKNISTKELVEELIKREGVESMAVDPHTEKELNTTLDYGVLEASRFIITTDEDYYTESIKNPKVIPMFIPQLLNSPITKEIHRRESGLNFYIFRIPVGR